MMTFMIFCCIVRLAKLIEALQCGKAIVHILEALVLSMKRIKALNVGNDEEEPLETILRCILMQLYMLDLNYYILAPLTCFSIYMIEQQRLLSYPLLD